MPSPRRGRGSARKSQEPRTLAGDLHSPREKEEEGREGSSGDLSPEGGGDPAPPGREEEARESPSSKKAAAKGKAKAKAGAILKLSLIHI